MPVFEWIILSLITLGHMALWTALVNRCHAIRAPRRWVDAASWACWLLMVLLPWGMFWAYQGSLHLAAQPWPLVAYGACCLGAGGYALASYLDRTIRRPDRHSVLTRDEASLVDLAVALGFRPTTGWLANWLTRIPGNQALKLCIHEKTLQIPRLPVDLEGLVIAHLSDLHLTGHLTREWLQEVVVLTNEARPDLVAITGDLFDHEECLAWAPDILTQLQAKHGVYFVLGNHDQWINHARVRARLGEAGLVDLGGKTVELPMGKGGVLLAGNELPWFRPAADMTAYPRERQADRPLRILLSHTPDQIGWARKFDFDLMLAGHTHGGQICLPLVGPIRSPSLYGVHYAAGTFYEAPTTLHVSRGLSGELPFRFRCPPELAFLVLRGQSVTASVAVSDPLATAMS